MVVKYKKRICGKLKKTVSTAGKRHGRGEIEYSAASQCKKDVPGAGMQKNAT